jgi:hypothetical protein
VRKRELRAEKWQTRAIQAAVADALDRGEAFHPQMLEGRGIGRTRAELIAEVSARQDLEDAMAAAAERAEFRRWQEERSASMSGTMSAPTPAEVAEREAMAARIAALRERKRLERKTITSARALARMDRESERARGFR